MVRMPGAWVITTGDVNDAAFTFGWFSEALLLFLQERNNRMPNRKNVLVMGMG